MIELIERFSRATGRVIAWLTLAMVLLTFAIVVLRYVFDLGFIWMQEIVVWLHAAVFMLGAAYALEQDQHVRVDVFYREMSPRRKAVVDLAGVIVLLMPLCAFFVWVSWDYVAASWRIQEASRQANGLGFPAPSLQKTLLILMPLLVIAQGLALALRSVHVLRGDRTDREASHSVSGGEL